MSKSDRTRQQLLDELQELTSRMMEAEETLRAIRGGEVDGLVVSTVEGDRVFTLMGAEHPYRVMVETMNEAAITLASDGTILYCNQRFADIVKGSLEKVIGSSIYPYISSKDLQLFKALVEQGLKGNSKEGELALQAGGENSVPVLLSVSPLQRTDMPGAVCAVMVDITERKKMEEALKISETRYRRLFEAAQDGILILDAETGQIVDVNPFLLEMLGYPHEELLGKKLWEIGSFRDIEASKATSSELKSKGYVRYHDLPLETKEGRLIAVEFVSNVYLVNDYKVIQCNIRDTTERKLTAEALKKSHNELERQAVELRTALSEIKTLKDRLEAENIYFRQEIKMKHQLDHILGQSDGLKYVLYRAEQVAPTNTTVLILGETGTGKELIAAAIHNMGPRKERPLITVNCTALPANLIESELFGREKGAFTGADTRQVGRFEVAHGSTLCLDEIGELPLEMQAKLLRVIQHNEFERLGSSHTIKVDVRIVATTNRNLEEEVRKGRFRQDLYYRLNVFPITVPPLRQRQEDIPLLVQAFVERYARKLGKQITSIQKETMKALQDYPWPGNVRELENIIERAVILCPGPILQLADKLEISSLPLSSAMRTLEETERNQILKTLSETRWRIEGKDGAAAILGLNPSTLRARMHKLGILRPETKEPE
ncbi:MAG: sigma 54-interacting transcriptional regulator [Thermodesulfobacteriota bacterium]|jgi:PAS domain S-box-containing protein